MSKRTILIVDDEPAIIRLVGSGLSRSGYNVLTAVSGPEALQIFDRSSSRIDVLLSDIAMPEMTGPELASRLRQKDPTLHVLFMSGYCDEVLSKKGIGQVSPLLSKPFTITELIRALDAMIAAPQAQPQSRPYVA